MFIDIFISYAGEVYMDGVSAFENTIQQYPGITVLELAPPINFAVSFQVDNYVEF